MLHMRLTLGALSPHLVAEELLLTTTETKLLAVLREAGACKHSSMHKREVIERTASNNGATCGLQLAYVVI